MRADLNKINVLTRREIEARIAGPLIKAFVKELWWEKTMAVVRPVIESLAREGGAQLAEKLGGNSMAHLAKGMSAWSAGKALEMEVLNLSDTKYDLNILRCAYAEMYKELEKADLGYELSCGRGFALIAGFDPRMQLIRTKTIMEGHDHCDFRITLF